jgi:TolA-binding protein
MKKIQIICAAALLLSGCATNKPVVRQGDVLVPEIDIVSVKENSDEALRAAQQARLDVEVLNARVTEMNNQVLGFSEEMASVSTAKLEELENRITVLTEEVKHIYVELDSLRLKARVPPRKEQPAVFDAGVFGPGGDSTLKLSGEDRKYRQAQSFFNAAQFVNAVVAFKEVLKMASQGKNASNAQYWIGESYFRLGQYAYAIANYKKVFAFANSEKADDSQIRIAASYQKLGDTEQAIVEYKNLLRLYPQSDYAEEARRTISQLEK